jgi:hypothetical protein
MERQRGKAEYGDAERTADAKMLIKSFKSTLLETPEFTSAVTTKWLNGSEDNQVEFKIGQDKYVFIKNHGFQENTNLFLIVTNPDHNTEESISIDVKTDGKSMFVYHKRSLNTLLNNSCTFRDMEEANSRIAVKNIEKILNRLKGRHGRS